MPSNLLNVVCLMGPTATGKTQLAIELTRLAPFEIISVDSAMVYRGMDIGTAKPSQAELANIPHHLIDICDPAESYSVGRFVEDASHLIDKILATQKIPLLVGGTMLYFHTLEQGMAKLPSADKKIRHEIDQEAHLTSWAELHKKLHLIDPQSAARIKSSDRQRIQRALEVYYLTDKTLTQWHQEQTTPALPYQMIHFSLLPPQRALLHRRIAERFEKMLKRGFVEEVKSLYARSDLSLHLPSIRTVGYRQMWEYLEGNYSFEEMKEKAIIATRQLAKRQITWLNQWKDLHCLSSEDRDNSTIILKKLNL